MALCRLGGFRRLLTGSASSGPTAGPPIQLFGVGGRYAHALYNAAAEEKAVEAVNAELTTIIQLSKSNESFGDFLKDPTIGKDEKKQKVGAMFSKNTNPVTSRFLGVLAENGRLPDLGTIVSSFQEIIDAYSGKVRAVVTTATEMSASEAKALEAALSKYLKKGQRLEVEKKVKPEILGGLIVNMGDKSMDLSVSSRIESYKNLIKDFSF